VDLAYNKIGSVKMKKINIALIVFMTVLSISCDNPKRTDADTEKKEIETSPKGDRAPASTMTGIVWLYPFATDSGAHWSAAKVTFEAGAHSNWHTHPNKQVVAAVEGVGYLKEKDKPVQVLHKGDVVDIPAGILHWHGAAPDNGFTQIVINPNIEKGVVTWLDRVTDEEYNSVSKP
jgi:quercetin dioxygenase-like cupin family protein